MVIPRVVECKTCGGHNLRPPSIEDDRIKLLNAKGEGFQGFEIECNGCSASTSIWEKKGNKITKAANDYEIPVFKDHTMEYDDEPYRRYVVLPTAFINMADPNSKINQVYAGRKLHLCHNCGEGALIKPQISYDGVHCFSCGKGVLKEHVYDTRDLLKKDIELRANKKEREEIAKELGLNEVKEEITEAANKGLFKSLLKLGVLLTAVIAAPTSYNMTNDTLLAEGRVLHIENNIAFAMVNFPNTRGGYTSEGVKVFLNKRNSLPGETYQIKENDGVSVHFKKNHKNLLSFIFHPFTGAEFDDGSVVNGKNIDEAK